MTTKKIIVNFFLAALLISGCTKDLEIKPTDVIIDEKRPFATYDGFSRGVIGAYSTLNGAITNSLYASALISDESMLPTENTNGVGYGTFRWQIDPGDAPTTSAWDDYYSVLGRINRVFPFYDTVKPANTTEVNNLKRMKGELHIMRAFCHFELLRNYAESYTDFSKLGVVVMEQSANGKPARNTVTAVLTSINSDIENAKNLIPASYTSVTEMNRNAIFALEARVALYSRDWDRAIAAATEAINAVPLAPRAGYRDIWTDLSNAEIIWKMRREIGQTRVGDLFFLRAQSMVLYAPSAELISLYDQNNDIRFPANIQVITSTRVRLRKYVTGAFGQTNLTDVKVFRTSEMYLIRAEAYAEKDDLVNAGIDINKLRSQRVNNHVDEEFLDKVSAIEAIRTERFKELPFEGHRYYDLRRWNLPITRIPADAINSLGNTILNPTDKGYIFPIPDGEIKANENMQQNPGY